MNHLPLWALNPPIPLNYFFSKCIIPFLDTRVWKLISANANFFFVMHKSKFEVIISKFGLTDSNFRISWKFYIRNMNFWLTDDKDIFSDGNGLFRHETLTNRFKCDRFFSLHQMPFLKEPQSDLCHCPKDIASNDQQGATHVFLPRRENYTFGFAALLPYYKYLTREFMLLTASLSLNKKIIIFIL